MTDDRSLERAARSWLEVGPTEAPERAVEAALLQIDSTQQERDWLPWRLPKMTGPLRVASAAVIGVLVVGGALYALAPGGSGPGGAASPSVSPTPSVSPAPSLSVAPSVVPSASAVFPAWYTGDQEGAGILAAGSQTTKSFAPSFTFTVPQGWVNNLDVPIAYALFPDTPDNEAEYAVSGDTARGIFMVTVESPYHMCEAWEKTQGTAAERAAFLVASEVFAASEPVDVTIGGLTGKQVDVQVDPAWKEACPDDPSGVDRGDMRTRVILLDTPDRGVIAIFVGSTHSAGHEAFLAEAMPIIESFQFDSAQ
jgi:hypothetical protein